MSELSKTAMLVSTTIKLEGLLGERRDKQATSYVHAKFGCVDKRAKASKFLIDRNNPSVKRVVAAQQRVRAAVYRYTFPWGDGKSGQRLLPVKALNQFEHATKLAMADLEDAIKLYIDAYPKLVADSQPDLGGLWDSSQYPAQGKLADMFVHKISYWPMPETGHFVADVSREAADRAKARMVEETRDRTLEAVSDLVLRIEDAVKTYAEKLAGYDPASKQGKRLKGIFRDSLVENVRDIGRLINTLNFTDDVRLTKLSTEVQRLAAVSADALRASDSTRSKAIDAAKNILNKLEQFKQTEAKVDEIINGMADYAL